MIFGLVQLVILQYSRLKKHMMRWKIIGLPCMQNMSNYTRYSIVQKLSNKQSAKVICKFDRLRTAHNKRYKKLYEHWKAYWLPMHLLHSAHG